MTEPEVVYEAGRGNGWDGRRGSKGPRTERPLSQRQRAILAFIIAYKEATQGHSPTIREIARATEITSTSVVTYNLERLATYGCIEWVRGGEGDGGGGGRGNDIRIPGARWVAPEGLDAPPVARPALMAAPPPMSASNLSDFATVDEVADILRIHPETVRRLIRQGRMTTALKIGNQWLVARPYLAAYAANYSNETGRRPLEQAAAWEMEYE